MSEHELTFLKTIKKQFTNYLVIFILGNIGVLASFLFYTKYTLAAHEKKIIEYDATFLKIDEKIETKASKEMVIEIKKDNKDQLKEINDGVKEVRNLLIKHIDDTK